MTPDEIRNGFKPEYFSSGYIESAQLDILRELTAQVAELNKHLQEGTITTRNGW